MKCFVICCLVAVSLAEPPRFRSARFRSQRQELAPTTTDANTEPTTDSTDDAPYPASGWKPAQPFTLPQKEAPSDAYGGPAQQNGPYAPSGWKPQGQAFTLPSKQQAPPATNYGVPDNTYGTPENAYGPPNTEASEPTTDNPQAEKLDGSVEVQKSIGTYYILLPNGQLQKVEFATENDIQNMAYTARLQVVDRAPLFVFRP